MAARSKLALRKIFMGNKKSGASLASVPDQAAVEASVTAENDNAPEKMTEMKGDALKYSFQTLAALEYHFDDIGQKEQFIKGGVVLDHDDGKCAVRGSARFTIDAAEEINARFNNRTVIGGLREKLGIGLSENGNAVIAAARTKLLRKEITEKDLSKEELVLVKSRQDQYPGLKNNPFSKDNTYLKDLKLLNRKKFADFLTHYQLLEYARSEAQANIALVKAFGKKLTAYRASLEETPPKKENGSPRFMKAQEQKSHFKSEHLRILGEDFTYLPGILATRKKTFGSRSKEFLRWLEDTENVMTFISPEEKGTLKVAKEDVKSYRRDIAAQMAWERNNPAAGNNDLQEIFSNLKEMIEDEIDRAHNVLSNEIRMASVIMAFLDVQEDRGLSGSEMAKDEQKNLQVCVQNINAQKNFFEDLVRVHKILCVEEQPLLFTNTFDTPAVAGVEYAGIKISGP